MSDTPDTPNPDTPTGHVSVAPTGDIRELRGHLMATIRQLRDKTDPMDCDRARVVSQVSGAVIDSLRAENEFLRVTGGDRGTGFIHEGGALPAPSPATPGQPTQPADAIAGVTRHLLR